MAYFKTQPGGTVTQTLEVARLAKSFGWKIMVANRREKPKMIYRGFIGGYWC